MDRYKQMQNKEQTETFYGKSAMVKQIDSLKIQLKDAEDVIKLGLDFADQVVTRFISADMSLPAEIDDFRDSATNYDKQYGSAAHDSTEVEAGHDKNVSPATPNKSDECGRDNGIIYKHHSNPDKGDRLGMYGVPCPKCGDKDD